MGVGWVGVGGEKIGDAIGDPELLVTLDDMACCTTVVPEPAAAAAALDGWRYPNVKTCDRDTPLQNDTDGTLTPAELLASGQSSIAEGGMMQRFHQCAVQHCRWCAFPVRRCFYQDHLSVCAPRPCRLCDAPVRTVDLAEHLAGPCKCNMVKCNTCLRPVLRKDLAMHHEVAHRPSAIEVKCPLRTSGCLYKGGVCSTGRGIR